MFDIIPCHHMALVAGQLFFELVCMESHRF
jgi:hypothetical protein